MSVRHTDKAIFGAIWLGLFAAPGATRAQLIPPGVPEPGLVIWGSVVNQNNPVQPITISSAAWSVTDGVKTAVYSSASRPPTRIVSVNGQSFYVLQIPFDTRQIGTITLADPASVGINSFALQSASPPTYTLTPTINGALATVRSIDGAPASGTNMPVAGFTSATRGRVIRVDLGIVPTVEDYTAWATRLFGNPNLPAAAPTADPDGDGMSNLDEYLAGNDPNDQKSALRILQLTIQGHPPQALLGWQSAPKHSYIIEAAAGPEGPWNELGAPITGVGAAAQANVDLADGDNQRFFRIRLVPQ